MGQFDRCCVRGCRKKRSQAKGLLSFYKIPRAPSDRKQAWVDFVRRKREAQKNWKVCSEHFISGKPSQKADSADYLPTLNGPTKGNKTRKKRGKEVVEVDSSVTSESQFGAGTSVQGGDDEIDDRRNSVHRGAEIQQVDIKKEPEDTNTTEGGSTGTDGDEQIAKSTEENPSPGPDLSVKVEVASNPEDEAVSDTDDDSVSSLSSSDGELPKRNRQTQCDVCGKNFRWHSDLNRHKRVHLKEPRPPQTGPRKRKDRYECTMCDKVLNSKYNLDKHLWAEHQQAKRFVCDLCGCSFIRHSGLTDHLLTHSGELPYQCSQCGKPFARKGELHTHELRTHDMSTTDSPLHTCPVCGMQFLVSSRLRAHMSKHVEPNEKCPFCGKMFRHACNLRTHIRGMHECDKKLQCSTCFRRFGNSYNLKVHERIHTGEKPYMCTICGKGFADVCNFRRHQEKCGESEPAQADISPVKAPRGRRRRETGDPMEGDDDDMGGNRSPPDVNSSVGFDEWQAPNTLPSYSGAVFPQAMMMAAAQVKPEHLPFHNSYGAHDSNN